jgi:hypothetical protein
MPLTTKKIKDKYRVTEVKTGKIAMNAAGTPIDGGGHSSEKSAQAQAAAVNISQARKRGEKVAKIPKLNALA